uniref:Transposase n=1 Tax=Steinernema glaseri TaxID=37863 RepID=A0A1I7YNR9_9BILA
MIAEARSKVAMEKHAGTLATVAATERREQQLQNAPLAVPRDTTQKLSSRPLKCPYALFRDTTGYDLAVVNYCWPNSQAISSMAFLKVAPTKTIRKRASGFRNGARSGRRNGASWLDVGGSH